eukprot:maker-scaffold48_size466083-snap-gene-3.28 protein:Tk05990 transcript:maker-scaffold48_size466083-snap-gene-3.28-mRNA-1 annotation:"major facilitator superfamily domain-containing protein 8 isoform x8"
MVPYDNKARVRSLYIVHLSMFILTLGSAIIYTGLFSYLQLLDPTVRLDEYGFVVAVDALAQMIFSPIFGIWADKLNSIRVVALICTGTFFFVPREIGGLHKPRVWSLLASRFIVGIGTSINASASSYVGKVTTLKERTTHVSLLSLFQTLGFVLGPALQAALTPIGEKDFGVESNVVFDMYTATGHEPWVRPYHIEKTLVFCSNSLPPRVAFPRVNKVAPYTTFHIIITHGADDYELVRLPLYYGLRTEDWMGCGIVSELETNAGDQVALPRAFPRFNLAPGNPKDRFQRTNLSRASRRTNLQTTRHVCVGLGGHQDRGATSATTRPDRWANGLTIAGATRADQKWAN